MRRRVFVTVLGSAAIWPLTVHAQKSDGVRRVGVIMGFAENDEVWQAYLSTFRQALQKLGWTEGHNIRFDCRFSGESEERMRRMAESRSKRSGERLVSSRSPFISSCHHTVEFVQLLGVARGWR